MYICILVGKWFKRPAPLKTKLLVIMQLYIHQSTVHARPPLWAEACICACCWVVWWLCNTRRWWLDQMVNLQCCSSQTLWMVCTSSTSQCTINTMLGLVLLLMLLYYQVSVILSPISIMLSHVLRCSWEESSTTVLDGWCFYYTDTCQTGLLVDCVVYCIVAIEQY